MAITIANIALAMKKKEFIFFTICLIVIISQNMDNMNICWHIDNPLSDINFANFVHPVNFSEYQLRKV